MAIFKLTLFTPPNPTVFNNNPLLCLTGRFWQACLISIVLGAFNTSTVGAKIWKKPTLHNLMEMVITKQYQVSNNLEWLQFEKQQKEKDQLLEKEITNNTDAGVLMAYPHDDVQTPRLPPNEVIRKLQQLDSEFKLSLRYCSSRNRDADFVLDLMNKQGKEDINWIIPIVQSEPDLMQTLPTSALITLLCNLPSSNNMVPKLVAKLNDLIAHGLAVEVFSFLFQERLAQPKFAHREIAKKALSLLFPSQQPQMSQSTTNNNNNQIKWLENLSSSPVLNSDVRQQIVIPALINALRYETNTAHLKSYITYLSNSISETDELIGHICDVLSELLQSRRISVSQLFEEDAQIGTVFCEFFLKGSLLKKSNVSNIITINRTLRNNNQVISTYQLTPTQLYGLHWICSCAKKI